MCIVHVTAVVHDESVGAAELELRRPYVVAHRALTLIFSRRRMCVVISLAAVVCYKIVRRPCVIAHLAYEALPKPAESLRRL